MIIASKAIKGSVFEIEMPSSGIRQYVVISDNSYNSRNNNCMLAVVCQEKEISKDNNNDYHETFELLIGNMPIKHVVCCERIYTLDQKRLKNYKYHLSEDIIEKVDTALMNVYFGKQMYTYEQMLIKREEEKIRLKVKYSSDALNCVPDKKEEANKQYDNIIENPNASIDEIQNIYASMMPDDATIYSQNKEELFNPVINEDVINKIIDEVQEEKEEVIESKVVLIRKEKKDKHKAVASKKIKEKKVADIVNEVIESRQEESVKRNCLRGSYIVKPNKEPDLEGKYLIKRSSLKLYEFLEDSERRAMNKEVQKLFHNKVEERLYTISSDRGKSFIYR